MAVCFNGNRQRKQFLALGAYLANGEEDSQNKNKNKKTTQLFFSPFFFFLKENGALLLRVYEELLNILLFSFFFSRCQRSLANTSITFIRYDTKESHFVPVVAVHRAQQ